jgi:bifunctional N-acetylglucosamine-1-phosphate-uridyltransferase/glucosamine-1-phosphate-acetyltransferase GlmU-like protein
VLGEKNVVKEVAIASQNKLRDFVQVEGVKAGDKVVLSPSEKVRDGATVALLKK